MPKQSVLTHIDAFLSRYPEETSCLEPLLVMIEADEDIASREHFAGHVTAGALLLDGQRRYLAIHHKQLDKWLCPGGHLEPGETDTGLSALRELTEETGITPASVERDPRWPGMPIHIDHHPIPANTKKAEPAHFHWDFLYVFTLIDPAKQPTLDLTEVTAFRWRPLCGLRPKVLSRLSQTSS